MYFELGNIGMESLIIYLFIYLFIYLYPGKEQWMDQSTRRTLVKVIDEGIIDQDSTDYDR